MTTAFRGIEHFYFALLPGTHRDFTFKKFSKKLPSVAVFFDTLSYILRQVTV
jgi:hypothetical protein